VSSYLQAGDIGRFDEHRADVAGGRITNDIPEGLIFATGVEHTVMWLWARTDQRP
jgi:hypothetical protein